MRRTQITIRLCLLWGLLITTACSAPESAAPTPTAPALVERTMPPATEPPAASPSVTSVAPTPEPPTVTSAPSPTVAPPTAAPPTPDYLAAPPERAPSPARLTHGKSYPEGAYEFIHRQFDVPVPPGRVPETFLAALPGVEAGLCPLTGEPAPGDIAARRPINVRIDNSPQGRPQAGLDNADVIWETLAEGGVTRLTVTFHCRTPATLGPVRSARLIDLHLTPMLGAWLVHVGASQPVTDMIWAAPFAERDIDEWAGDPAFYRIDQAPVGWLRTYTRNQLIQGVIAERAAAVGAPSPLRGWRFSPSPAAGGSPATFLHVPHAGGSSAVSYRYDGATGRYWRSQGDAPHITQSGTQLGPQNVVVIFAEEWLTPIVEDSLGNRSLHYQIWGRGPALLLRDGQLWQASWKREGENVLIRIVDDAGDVLPFRPGQTIVHVVPSEAAVSWE